MDLFPLFLRLIRGTDFNAGVGIVEMLGQTNYLAIVGGGKQPKFAQNKVYLVLMDDWTPGRPDARTCTR